MSPWAWWAPVAFTHNVMPAIRPVNQVVQDGNLMIRSHPGATLVAAARNGEGAVAAYEVGMIDPGSHGGWSVGALGPGHPAHPSSR